MNALIFAILAIIGIGAVGVAFVPSVLGVSRAEKRRRAYQGDIQANRRENNAAQVRESRRKNIQQTLKQQTAALGKKRRNVPLQDQIFQAGMKVTKRNFIRNQIIVGVIAFIIVFVLQVPLLYCFVFAVAAGYLLPKFYLGRKRKKFQSQFLEELPNAVEAIVRGVKSGLPLNDSMRVVAKEVKEPVKSEFQRVLDQQSMGKSMNEAVQILFERVPLPEVNFFVVVISVQSQAGGNLSEALGNLSRVLRNRKKMKQKVKAMSSEAKASAGIIGSLPFIVAILVTLTTPGYLLPLVQTQIGMIWLGVAALMMSTGIFIMNRMIQFDF
jgi:tight adherence protein B